MKTQNVAIQYYTWLRGNNIVAVGNTETEGDANFMNVILKIIYHVSLMMIRTVVKLLVSKLTIMKSAI